MGPIPHSEAQRILAGLNDALDGALHRDWLDEVVGRPDALGGTAVGQIVWPKSIGRPAGALRSGFEIHEEVFTYELDEDTGTWKEIHVPAGITPHGVKEPEMWDGPDDDRFHRVTCMSFRTPVTGGEELGPRSFSTITVNLVDAN